MLIPPVLLHYYITYQCNCRCSFCNIWSKSDSVSFAQQNDVFQNLAEAKKLGVKFVDFTGGEPLLHPQLDKMLTEANRVGLKTSVTTNCLLYPDKAEQLAGKIDFLHFSLDALDEEIHNSTRNKTCFQSVMKSIDCALNLGEKPDLLFTVSEKNIKQLPFLIKFAQKLGLMLIVNPVFSYFENQSKKSIRRWDQITCLNSPNVYVNKALIRLHQSGGNNIKHPRCKVVDSCIVISPDNEMILPCYHRSHKKLPIFGSLKKIRSSNKVIEFRKLQGRFSWCRDCKLNCYFDPSFMYKLDGYFLQSLQAKVTYYINKNFLINNKRPQQPALKIAKEILAKQISSHAEQNEISTKLKQCA